MWFCTFRAYCGASGREVMMALSDLGYNNSSTAVPQELCNPDAPAYTEPFATMLTTVMQLFSSLSVIAPALFIIAVIIQQPRLNNFRYWFIGNLLACNVLVAILFLPAAINVAVHMVTGHVFSMQFIVSFASIPSVAYGLMSCVIFADMFCFLFFDSYQDYLTPKKVIVMAVIPWVISCAIVVILSIRKASDTLSDRVVLLITSVIMLVIKIFIGVAVVCLNVFLFYYWTKVNMRLQAEVFNSPTAQNKNRLHKQINIFVRVESCIKPLFAFFSISVFNMAFEITKVIIIYDVYDDAPVSFVIFVIMTWLECIFCVLTYSILLMTFYPLCSYFKRNTIMPA